MAMKFQGRIPVVVIAACMLAVPAIYAGQDAREPDSERAEWNFFASEGRLGAIRPDGTGEHYPDFGLPALRLWRMHSVSLDGREAELLTPDSGKWWRYDFVAKTIREIRDYHPEQARGGTQICLLDPKTGKITPLTHDAPPTWNFRLAWSPDGSQLAYLRADVGCLPESWVMDADGGNRRRLTRGLNDMGADHPRWIWRVRGVSPGTPAAPGPGELRRPPP